MLITILTKLLIEKQFIINSNDIFEYILRRVDRSYQGIYEIVNKLIYYLLKKKTINNTINKKYYRWISKMNKYRSHLCQIYQLII